MQTEASILMKRFNARVVSLALLSAFAIAARLEGQADPDSVKLRNSCRLALQVLATGVPAPKREWAQVIAPQCNVTDRQVALVAGVNRLRTSHDIRELEQVVESLVSFHDGQLFAAVLGLAGDNGASNEARIEAFVALKGLSSGLPGLRYADFAAGISEDGIPLGRCGGFSDHKLPWTDGVTPLPADFKARITRVAGRVRRDTSLPGSVRGAAGCAG